VMSIPDELIENYFELVLCYPNEAMSSIRKELKRSNPRDLKFRLATEIVSLYHNKDKAKKSAEEFERVFKLKKLPTNIPELIVNTDSGSIWIVKLLTTSGMANTNSEARRLIEQGGVEIANKKITDTDATIKLEEPFIMKVGKRRFLKIIPGKSEKI